MLWLCLGIRFGCYRCFLDQLESVRFHNGRYDSCFVNWRVLPIGAPSAHCSAWVVFWVPGRRIPGCLGVLKDDESAKRS